MRRIFAVFILLLITCVARAETKSLFDPARHMRVSEVKPGMKGYGLSVFKGTKIEKFDVEVVSVLKNFNPKYDVVLINCKGQNLEHTGAIAGMSGSPIFLDDGSGKARMIGAFAYGWPMVKDPLAGVQPIEYMLQLPVDASPPATQSTVSNPQVTGQTEKPAAEPRGYWNYFDYMPMPGAARAPARFPLAKYGSLAPNPELFGDTSEITRLRPLATPLMVSGVSPKVIEQFNAIFNAYGMSMLQAGGVGGGAPSVGDAPQLEPGSVLAVPLVEGDMDLTAIGTCTEVIGKHIFGFGHAFNNEGVISIPMGSGQINGIVANLMTSFKLGSMGALRGTLTADQTVGVGGKIGKAPAMIPLDVKIIYTDGSGETSYHFDCAAHPKLTPMIVGVAMTSALTGARELPQYQTLDYDVTIDFAGGRKVRAENTLVNAQAGDIFFQLGTPLMAAAENPFERVMPTKISGTFRVTPQAREAQILSINVPRLKHRPGEHVRAFVQYRPFRATEQTMPVDIDLPKDLPDGDYQLVISDWQRYLTDEQAAKPFRFTAQDIKEVFAVLKDVNEIRHNALYVRLLRQPDGVAIGRTAMTHMPSSKRHVLLGSGRSNISPFMSSAVKIVPTQNVMEGSAEFTITIDSEIRVEVAGKPPKAEQVSPKGEEPRAKPAPAPSKSEPAPAPAPASPSENAPSEQP
jgi:hypothetical protein